jgi:hypothetical protein
MFLGGTGGSQLGNLFGQTGNATTGLQNVQSSGSGQAGQAGGGWDAGMMAAQLAQIL